MNNVDTPPQSLSYSDAGVNIDAGNELVQRIKPHVKRTARPELLSSLGGFNALFEIPLDRYQKPVLVSGTDGVGTKLKLALQLKQHDTIGIDLVAMCVNDILVCGAEPLFFLDYYATSQLQTEIAEQVVAGIADGCELAGAALVGGETAEMPDMYAAGEYDLAGFTVGIVERARIIDGEKVTAGDVLLGLASSGPHSNGFSLIRKVLEVSKADLESSCGDTTLAKALMAPTRIYVKTILELLKQHDIHSMSHITGGGLLENIPRTLPPGHRAIIDTSAWEIPPVFQWLQQHGNIDSREMLRTFNCGIGFVLCVEAAQAADIEQALKNLGETVYRIGCVEACHENDEAILIQ